MSARGVAVLALNGEGREAPLWVEGTAHPKGQLRGHSQSSVCVPPRYRSELAELCGFLRLLGWQAGKAFWDQGPGRMEATGLVSLPELSAAKPEEHLRCVWKLLKHLFSATAALWGFPCHVFPHRNAIVTPFPSSSFILGRGSPAVAKTRDLSWT